ncbi:MAG: SpoVA/SpoVAEb family sporulation membrane protein [Faecalibacterium sp.]
MKMTAEEYARRVRRVGPPSPVGKDCVWAFCVGGGICLLGEVLRQRYLAMGLETDLAGTLTSCTLIVLSAIFTTLGWYQKLAAKAGAGSLVPITGFANSVVSAAIEFKTEGHICGTGAKMFTIAGPVIVYGTLAAVIYGAALWLGGMAA